MNCGRCRREVPVGNFCDQCGSRLAAPGVSGAAVPPPSTTGSGSATHPEARSAAVSPSAKTVIGSASSAGDLIDGKYQLLREIGRGGMGIVYKAMDAALQRPVALKKLPPDLALNPTQREKLLTEARRLAGLSHDNIVRIHGVAQERGNLWLVLEYVEGRTLEAALRAGPLALGEFKRMAAPICSALAYAHAQGVTHRDLKPSNIILSGRSAKLMDFGIARGVQETGASIAGREPEGTFAYMAPEQHGGKSDPRSDIFSFGATCYEALSRARAFPGPDFLAQKRGRAYEPLDPKLPAGLRGLVDDCLNPDPAGRPTAGEILNALAGTS